MKAKQFSDPTVIATKIVFKSYISQIVHVTKLYKSDHSAKIISMSVDVSQIVQVIGTKIVSTSVDVSQIVQVIGMKIVFKSTSLTSHSDSEKIKLCNSLQSLCHSVGQQNPTSVKSLTSSKKLCH